jgi:hypothetical protein
MAYGIKDRTRGFQVTPRSRFSTRESGAAASAEFAAEDRKALCKCRVIYNSERSACCVGAGTPLADLLFKGIGVAQASPAVKNSTCRLPKQQSLRCDTQPGGTAVL